MTRDEDEERLADIRLWQGLLAAELRYQQMTAAAIHAIGFLASTEEHSKSAAEFKPAMERFQKYLSPHSFTFQTFFAGMLLTNIIAELEGFLVEAMKLLLVRYPGKVGSAQFRLADVLEKKPEELVLSAAEERLSKLMYKRPAEYVAELTEILAVDAAPIQQHWPLYVEAKARRDLGVHNGSQINDTYRRKVAEAGLELSQYKGPDLQPNFKYVSVLENHCDKIVRSIARQLEEKYKPQ